MKKYTIEDFWIRRLDTGHDTSTDTSVPLVEGWSFEHEGLSTFKEAPLTLSSEVGGDGDPETSPILLVSAPGAVGKSTLAKEIAVRTGSIYIDLAKAQPVAGYTLTGGLVRSKVKSKWDNNSVTVLIDGLDEARLRTKEEAFYAFLSDVEELSKDSTVPTVLFGRTGAVQEAWLILSENVPNIAVLEIGYYKPEASVDFAEATLHTLKPNSPHQSVEREALELLLKQLRSQTESDGDRFAGYAPVLRVVAERVAKETNPSELVSTLKQVSHGEAVTLQTVVSAILEREQGKLKELEFENPSLSSTLYSPKEQLSRLIAHVYKVDNFKFSELPEMSSEDTQTYSSALETWVSEHPFLAGGPDNLSAVFEGMISAAALHDPATSASARQQELSRGSAANPFLYAFYREGKAESESSSINPEHIGVVYASVRASLARSETARLSVEGNEGAEEEESLRAEVDITIDRIDTNQSRVLRFDTDQTGIIHLGTHIENVDIETLHAHVEIGPGDEVVLVAPINIECEELSISTKKVIVESHTGKQVVFLGAEKFSGESGASVPVLRSSADLSVSWPGAKNYPWTNFATKPPSASDPRVDEALRRLRRFVTEFRSHGNKGLARSKKKIENPRMTKGTGQAILNSMLANGVLHLKQPRHYFLNVDRLSELIGATYHDCMARRFGPKAVSFVQEALRVADN